MLLRDLSQIGLLWQEASDQTNGIFNRATFVTVERFAKVGAGAKNFVGTHMLCVLRPVIVSDREPKGCRIAAESSSQSSTHGSCSFGFEFSQLCISGFALHGHLDRLVAFTAADGIGFPMANDKALENCFGTLFDRDSLRNMRFFMFPGVPSVFAFAMGSHQGQNEMGDLLVDPLIDGLMANGESRMVRGNSSGNKLWRPSQAKTFFGILANKVVFKPLSSMGFVVTLTCSFLSFVRQIIAGVNRRGISLKLP